MQVALHVEVLVLHPHRVVEVEEAVGELLPESRDRGDPQGHFVAQALEAVSARDGGRVQLQHRTDVQRLGRGFQVEKTGIEAAEPLQMPHMAMVGPPNRTQSSIPEIDHGPPLRHSL